MKKILMKCIRCGEIFGCWSSNGKGGVNYFICADGECGKNPDDCPEKLTASDDNITNMVCPLCIARRHPPREEAEELIIHM